MPELLDGPRASETSPRRRRRLTRLPAPIRERDPRAEVRRRDALFRRALATADVLAAAGAVVICVTVVGADELRLQLLLALPLVLIAAKLGGVYDRDEIVVNKTTLDQAPQLFQLATLYTLLFVVLQDHLLKGDLGALQLVVLWGTMFVFTLLARRGARGVARSLTPQERCLFVGVQSSCERLQDKLAATGSHAAVVVRIDLPEAPDDALAVEAAATLHRLVDEFAVHRVIIEPNAPRPQMTLDLVREAKATGARVSVLPRILEVVGSAIEIDDVQGLTLLGLRHFGLSRSSALLKRSFDAVGAAFLLAVLSPLLAVIAVAIRLDSPGGVIYRQPRVGREGRLFDMWKFRTMVRGADTLKSTLTAANEDSHLFKVAGDPRITRVGRTLRSLSLDELPQLVNVLKGEMSLVGPRPLVADDDGRITGLDRRRLFLTPGMTGHWQVMGATRLPLAEMLKLDYLYVATWSLWTDVKILMRTVPYLLARRNM
ncbi:exopolysaccharide biosynthesis polyprenyl glycosylphosphotransferase [Solirubrobacter ginsenosidimutans]|uniref:Exopolysaccharide biosynthesis polyprenyl glycosylphosphotransferase n=1 Tax=Solirubrobacter ginsenosidimutans TaxID=490573 RepID=A0A9X3MYA0_9ACTN|nr:exopolysaccharide biosynthesis polyprenyl glycosylphosphotransferase [Solirubrobacter ginsenosidimutans]MDA0163856.1 exopolysaccharide biosynthesis polyprenyl glycosylphosphotransferase [Solirubrobacter ginsenosidimutans]